MVESFFNIVSVFLRRKWYKTMHWSKKIGVVVLSADDGGEWEGCHSFFCSVRLPFGDTTLTTTSSIYSLFRGSPTSHWLVRVIGISGTHEQHLTDTPWYVNYYVRNQYRLLMWTDEIQEGKWGEDDPEESSEHSLGKAHWINYIHIHKLENPLFLRRKTWCRSMYGCTADWLSWGSTSGLCRTLSSFILAFTQVSLCLMPRCVAFLTLIYCCLLLCCLWISVVDFLCFSSFDWFSYIKKK